MTTKHCIITRFSFRFRPDLPTEPLLSEERLRERIRLFRKFCYPSIANQTNKRFYWILIIDPLLPIQFKEELESIAKDHEKTIEYQKKGPRKIWIHTWDWENHKLDSLDWVMPYFETLHRTNNDTATPWTPPKYFITTRLDDDDCLVSNFIDMVHNHMKQKPPVNGFRYLSYGVGYYHYVNQKSIRMNRLPLIALGLTLITETAKYPMTAYLGNHTRIASYVKDPTRHARFLSYYKKNKDLPTNQRQIQDRLKIFRSGPAIWIRNIHGFNLQKNIGRMINKNQQNNKGQEKVKQILNKQFNVIL